MITKTVTVHHSPGLTSPPALVAALNAAHLEASLTAARRPAAAKRSWVPPKSILLAAVLLLVSCVHYLHGPTGASSCARAPFHFSRLLFSIDRSHFHKPLQALQPGSGQLLN